VRLGQRRIPSLSLLIAAVIVGLDQLSKHWAVSQLNDGHTVHVLWTLQFNLAFNGGMAFGRGQGLGPIIGVIATIVVVGLVLSLRQSEGKMSIIAVGLIVGGAMATSSTDFSVVMRGCMARSLISLTSSGFLSSTLLMCASTLAAVSLF